MKTTYSNQRAILINRDMPAKGSGRKFLSAYYDNISKASRLLSGEVAFKLYLYLLSNQDKYVDNFSPQNFSNDFGVSVDRTRKVFEQLEEAGYLVKTASNEYQFYEVPQKKYAFVNPYETEKRLVQTTDGFIEITYAAFRDEAKASGWTDKDIEITWNRSELMEENRQ